MPDLTLAHARRRATIAAILGLEADAIAVEEIGQQLMQEGVIVDLTLSRWRARQRLALDDLGLPPLDPAEAQAIHGIFRLGEKRLLPDSYFNRLVAAERAIYRALERHSFPSPWGRFVPATAFPAWQAAHAEAAAVYLGLRDEIVRDYPQILGLLREQYTIAARRAYRVLSRLERDPAAGPLADPETFVGAMWERIAAAIPTAAAIAQSFCIEVAYRLVPLPTLLAQAEDDAPRHAATVAALRRRVSVAAAAEARRQRLIEAMHREVLAQARAQKAELIDRFLATLVAQLRGLIYQVCADTLAALEGKPTLHSRSVAALRDLVASVGRLNFFGDTEATAMITQIQRLLDLRPEERSPAEIQQVLQAIGTVARSSLIALGEAPRSARAVGIADAPSAPEIRAARAALGLGAGSGPARGGRDPVPDGDLRTGASPPPRRGRAL